MLIWTLAFGCCTIPIVGWVSDRLRVKYLREWYSSLILALPFIPYILLLRSITRVGILVYPTSSLFHSSLTVDMVSAFFILPILLVGFASSIYSASYMSHDTGLNSYYTLLSAMILGMTGVVSAGDFFTFFLFWEIMSISSYALVAFRKNRWEPVEAGFKYLVMSSAGSALMLSGIAIVYGIVGTLNFAGIALATRTPTLASDPWLILAVSLLIVGLGIKAAIAPMHTWLPDAHPAAPSPISSLLSGVMIKTGVYGLLRFYILFQTLQAYWSSILSILAFLTMFIGNLTAIFQTDIKRLLAYSSIAQIGYITFALSIGTVYSISAGLLHLFNHAMMKGLLFMAAGAFYHATGSRDISVLEGIGRRMKLTGVILSIGLLAIAGMPGLNGFISELLIVSAAIHRELYLQAALTILNFVISVAYYLRLLQRIMLREPKDNTLKVEEAPATMIAGMIILTSLCIFVGVYPSMLISISELAGRAALDIGSYIAPIFGG
ncbi:MAG: proton-conducting transporter membrane subunit [Candidatus Bathyarchaeia archaeon]